MSGPNERDEIAADREALARVVGGHLPQSRGAGRWPGCFSHPRIEDWTPDHLADAILESEWLAERDRRTAATAVRAMGARFRNEGRETWGGDVGWTTTGSKVAALAASWCDEEADRIEAERG